MIDLVYNDGGRKKAGLPKTAKDCVVRAIAIATEIDYLEVREQIEKFAKSERTGKRKRGKSCPDKGVYRNTTRKYLASIGWQWVATMQIGSGCKVHLKADELPKGRLIVKVTSHLCAVIDGVVHDTSDPSRDGTRCVYGYYVKSEN